MALFVSAVVRLKSQTVSLRRSLRRVRSGVDKAPSCELTPGSPSPPPCQLHRAIRLRSHPSHFASTASSSLPTTSVDQNAKAYPHSPHGSRLRFPTDSTVI